MIKEFESNNSNEWNLLAKHPLQSFEWGEARKQMGIKVVRLGEYHNNTLKNVFQFTLHQVPKTPYFVGYIPRTVFPSTDVLNFLKDYGKKNNVIFFQIEPNVLKTTVNYHLSSINYQLHHSKHPLFPSWTQILDLTKNEEELLQNMKSKTRYNIKLAQKKGVLIKEMSNNQGFEIFSKLYFETCKRQKYYGHDVNYHQIIWNNLKNNIAHIIIAFKDQTPLAAYELFNFNNILYYPYGGSSNEFRNLMAANLIMWEAIKLGKKLKATSFDMWGSLPPDYNQNNPWSGFTKFKEGYGTSFTEFIGSYDLIINPILYTSYNLLYNIRSFVLTLRR
ncbi:MAG: peptidoglycan bridge formation glycyltransferase FemA/FemB family protein [bacterium]|nr:peptidoglycan bridge formation glycyltransferase FemA/FemB family protein [bacterium]